jgi:hypothetical protein
MVVCCSQARSVCSIAMLEAMIALTLSWMGAFLTAVTCVLPVENRQSTREARQGFKLWLRKVPGLNSAAKHMELESDNGFGPSLTQFGISVPF